MRKRAESIGLLGAIGALAAFGWYRVVEWTPSLSARAYGHRSDFAEYYLTASIGARFGWHSLYSSSARDAVARTFGAPPLKTFPIDFPPTVGWLVRPLTGFSLGTSYWIWLSGLIAAYVGMWWLLAEGSWLKRVVLLIAPLTLFPVVFGFALGQLVGIELLGVAVAYVCLSRGWDLWAGLALSPLLLHPQCLLLVPVILVPLGRWRAVAGFVATAAVQALLIVTFLGPSGVRGFLHALNYVHAHRIAIWSTLSFPLAVHDQVASVAATAAVVLVVVTVALRNRDDLRSAFAAAIVGSLLVAPFIHIQDEMSLVVAGWLLLAGRPYSARSWLPVAAACLMAFDQPATGFSWGYLLMGLEVVWLISFLGPGFGAAASEPVEAVHAADHRDSRFGMARLAESFP